MENIFVKYWKILQNCIKSNKIHPTTKTCSFCPETKSDSSSLWMEKIDTAANILQWNKQVLIIILL